MFCGERLGKLVLIQAMRSDSVRMLEGGMRVPSFALFCGHLRSVIPRGLVERQDIPQPTTSTHSPSPPPAVHSAAQRHTRHP